MGLFHLNYTFFSKVCAVRNRFIMNVYFHLCIIVPNIIGVLKFSYSRPLVVIDYQSVMSASYLGWVGVVTAAFPKKQTIHDQLVTYRLNLNFNLKLVINFKLDRHDLSLNAI